MRRQLTAGPPPHALSLGIVALACLGPAASSARAQAPQALEEAQAPQALEEAQAPQALEEAQAPQALEEAQAPQALEEAQAPQEPPPLYRLDPITDSIVIGVSFFAGLGSEMTIRSGELQAATPGPVENIPVYDRWVAEGGVEQSGDLLSNVGVGLAIGYGIFDSVQTGVRHGSSHGWTEFAMYLESGLVNWTLVNVVKLTVRRPRPSAYNDEPDMADTNRDLSFYSGHAAVTAGLAGTASYLIFNREGESAHAWTVLGVGTALTAFVGINRVRVRSHFPSDVIVGAMVGASVGVLIPHFHQPEDGGPHFSFYSDGQTSAGGAMTMQF
jgi:undecaprenyl-diphosphatase